MTARVPAPVPAAPPPGPAPLRAWPILKGAAALAARDARVLFPIAFAFGIPMAAARLVWPAAADAPGLEPAHAAADILFGSLEAVVLTAAALPVTRGARATLAVLRGAGGGALSWAFCAAVIPSLVQSAPLSGTVLATAQPFLYFAVQSTLFLAVPVALLEPGAGLAALTRSETLLRGKRWVIVRVLLGISLVAAIPVLGLLALGMLPPTTVPGALAFAGVMATLGVLEASARAVAYRLLRAPDRTAELAAVFE